MKPSFPPNFLWGAATAAYQIEGAVTTDGRGPSIWDHFSHLPGKIANNDTGDVACDHYHRFPEDIQIMKAMGLNSYRTSISWPRIFPQGKGQVNQAGLDFYQRLTDSLLTAGIEPLFTIFHWDLPAALQDLGGWANRDLTEYFRDYAVFLFEHLGDRVHRWITINEPAVHTIAGHLEGTQAPGIKDWKIALQTAHHLLLSHGLALQAFRTGNHSGELGITLNLGYFEPASASPADQEATKRMDGLWNRWFLDPLFKGTYPVDMWQLYENQGLAPQVAAGDFELIQQPADFLGINYYFRELIKFNPHTLPPVSASAIFPPPPRTAMEWEIYPKGLYRLLTRIKREYSPLPLYITESGAAFPDHLIDGIINDSDRINYLLYHFEAAASALAEGVDLRGYYIWSLLDNFEWSYGYDKRFGLIYIDYETQQRYWKQSAYWYQAFIKQQRFG